MLRNSHRRRKKIIILFLLRDCEAKIYKRSSTYLLCVMCLPLCVCVSVCLSVCLSGCLGVWVCAATPGNEASLDVQYITGMGTKVLTVVYDICMQISSVVILCVCVCVCACVFVCVCVCVCVCCVTCSWTRSWCTTSDIYVCTHTHTWHAGGHGLHALRVYERGLPALPHVDPAAGQYNKPPSGATRSQKYSLLELLNPWTKPLNPKPLNPTPYYRIKIDLLLKSTLCKHASLS